MSKTISWTTEYNDSHPEDRVRELCVAIGGGEKTAAFLSKNFGFNANVVNNSGSVSATLSLT